MSEPTEGWADVGAGRWHYIKPDGRSLCGRWMHLGRSPLEQGGDDSPDNCAECRRRLAKRTERQP